MIEIWLNPTCSKCRTALSELEASGAEYTVRRYLEEPPTVTDIHDVLARLGVEPWHIARTADAKSLGLALPERSEVERETWIQLLADNPKLIQRPILTATDGTTVVGRDADSLAKVIAAG